jgi:hypothetical protein
MAVTARRGRSLMRNQRLPAFIMRVWIGVAGDVEKSGRGII